MEKRQPAFLPVAPIPDANLDLAASLDMDTARSGPGRDHVINTVIGRPFSELLRDLSDKTGVPLHREPGTLPQSIGSPIRGWAEALMRDGNVLMSGEDGYQHVVELPADVAEHGLAVVLGDEMDGYKIRGLMLGEDFAVEKSYQGLGYGTGLVAASILYKGGLKSWDQEAPAYSVSGEIAVMKGAELAERFARDVRKEESPQP